MRGHFGHAVGAVRVVGSGENRFPAEAFDGAFDPRVIGGDHVPETHASACRTRSTTCWIMGRPAIAASGFPGNLRRRVTAPVLLPVPRRYLVAIELPFDSSLHNAEFLAWRSQVLGMSNGVYSALDNSAEIAITAVDLRECGDRIVDRGVQEVLMIQRAAARMSASELS